MIGRRYVYALAAALVILSPLAAAPGEHDLGADVSRAYGSQVTSVLQASAQKLFERQVGEDDMSSELALQCLAAAKLAPYYGQRAVSVTESAADELVAMSGVGKGGDVGWGIPLDKMSKAACAGAGTEEMFHTTCEPPGMKLTFRTSLGLICMAKAYQLTHKPEYLSTAQAVIASSWDRGGRMPGCTNCFYYWKSYNSADANRYVRNTNTLMGMGLALVYRQTKDPKLLERIREIANSERAEAAAGNEGYYGIADLSQRQDPGKEKARIENHVPYTALGLLEIGRTLNDQTAISEAAGMMSVWMNCRSEYCSRKSCAQWAGNPDCMVTQNAAPCFFRSFGGEFDQRCRQFVSRAQNLNPYQIWAVMTGLNDSE